MDSAIKKKTNQGQTGKFNLYCTYYTGIINIYINA